MIALGLIGIPSSKLPLFWCAVAGTIAAGLRKNNSPHSVHDIAADLQAERKQLFVTPDIGIAVVTEITETDGIRSLTIFLAAGRLPDNWRALLGTIENWGRQKGCSISQLTGRRGWLRLLPDYKPGGHMMIKEL